MKKARFPYFFLLACLFLYLFRYNLYSFYIDYKYPKPIDFYGLQIPVEKGFQYSKSKKGIRVSHPFSNKYSVSINRNAKLTSNFSSAKELIELLGNYIITIENKNINDIEYTEIHSVNRNWQYEVTAFFSNHNLIITYQGSKLHFYVFKEIVSNITKDLNNYIVYKD